MASLEIRSFDSPDEVRQFADADVANGQGAMLSGSLTARLSGIEQRLVQQETFMRRAGTFIQDFFNKRGSDAS